MKLASPSKIVLAVVLLGALTYAVTRLAARDETEAATVAPSASDDAGGETDASTDGASRDAEVAEVRCADRTDARFLLSARAAQAGALYASGAPRAAEGSLLCKAGVDVQFALQEDTALMQKALVSFATELSKGLPQPFNGAAFVAIDGAVAPLVMKQLADALGPLGPRYGAKIVAALGRSRGSDRLLGPSALRDEPESARGLLVAAAEGSGAFAVAQGWVAAHGLCSNPDPTRFDPDCVNWLLVRTPAEAVARWEAETCEERPLVVRGKPSRTKKRVCVGAVATRTPGDVQVARGRGGLVSLASTRDDGAASPVLVVGIDAWMQQNRALVEAMVGALLAGGRDVKGGGEAARRGAEVSADAYNDGDTDTWLGYLEERTIRDTRGLEVTVGGGDVMDLEDDLRLFDTASGASDGFAASYQRSAELLQRALPTTLSAIVPPDAVVDTSYLRAAAREH